MILAESVLLYNKNYYSDCDEKALNIEDFYSNDNFSLP